MYSLTFKTSARKELDRITDPEFLRIDKAILALKNQPRSYPQSKKLEGENKFRLRVGDYRIVYEIDDKQKIVTIYRVRHRKDVYRR